VSAFLQAGTRTGKLGYIGADGRPLVAPVWFIVEDGCIVFNTGKQTVKGRALAREPRTMVFFETARRLGPTLTEMAEIFGASREAAVTREIGKTYEEVVRANLGELADRFAANPARGEITLVVAGIGRAQERTGGVDLAPALTVELLCEAGLSLKQASAVIARLGGLSRRAVYQDELASRRLHQGDNKPDDDKDDDKKDR